MTNVFLCLRSGGEYSINDVFLLSRHLHEKSEHSVNIYCLWDKITQSYVMKDVTFLPMARHWRGWWSKMNLFSPDLESYRPYLYLDLDTAVVDNLYEITPPLGDNINKFITLGSFRDTQTKKELQSGMMWFPANSSLLNLIWSHWIVQPEYHIKNLRGDQDFIHKIIVNPEQWWQLITDKICSFKINMYKEWLHTIPEKVSIVCFHGKPKITEASSSINWVNDYINE